MCEWDEKEQIRKSVSGMQRKLRHQDLNNLKTVTYLVHSQAAIRTQPPEHTPLATAHHHVLLSLFSLVMELLQDRGLTTTVCTACVRRSLRQVGGEGKANVRPSEDFGVAHQGSQYTSERGAKLKAFSKEDSSRRTEEEHPQSTAVLAEGQ